MSTLKNLVDETTNIKNELVTCHANLKNNLIEKGVEVLPSDKMSTLISKVSNILGIKGIIAGISTLEFEDEAEYTTKSSNFEVVKTITLNTRFPQEGRSISFDIRKTTTATTTAKAKFHIKRNGEGVFTSNEFTNSSASTITCTTDVFIKTGDVIEFMINRASLTTSAECAIKNIKSTYEYVF